MSPGSWFVLSKLVRPNGGRRKCRAVICGNLVQDPSADPLPGTAYASGADGILIRAALNHGCQRGWGISTVDVKTAFLLAPRPRPTEGKEAVVVPPKALVLAGVCSPTERWRVHKALYGFQSSPARWANHRDQVLKGFSWDDQGERFWLKSTPEVNFWKVMKGSGDTGEECVGHLIVYVDDMMVIASQEVRDGFLRRLSQEWNTSAPEHVNCRSPVRFAGFELQWLDDGQLKVHQGSYTQELLGRYGNPTPRWSPVSKLEVPEHAEEGITIERIREAQTITGESVLLGRAYGEECKQESVLGNRDWSLGARIPGSDPRLWLGLW